MTLLQNIIRSVRNIRAEMNVAPSKPIHIQIKAASDKEKESLIKNKAYLEKFCNPETLDIQTELKAPEKSVSAIVTGAEIYLPLEGLINIDEEINRLEKELEKLNFEVERVQKKLSNQGFVNKAPKHIVDEEKEKEKDYLEKRRKVEERIRELKQ